MRQSRTVRRVRFSNSTGTTTARAALLLNRTRRTVRDWRTGCRPVPRWAFQLVYYAALDLPELVFDRCRYRPWIDLRRHFGEPANDPLFLEASQQAVPGATWVPPDAAPQPGIAGSDGSPCGARA